MWVFVLMSRNGWRSGCKCHRLPWLLLLSERIACAVCWLLSLCSHSRAGWPSPQAQWREFRSDTDGFTVSLPQTPAITSRRIGTSNATQTNFLIEAGAITYLVSLIQLEQGKGPKNPDQAYFRT